MTFHFSKWLTFCCFDTYLTGTTLLLPNPDRHIQKAVLVCIQDGNGMPDAVLTRVWFSILEVECNGEHQTRPISDKKTQSDEVFY